MALCRQVAPKSLLVKSSPASSSAPKPLRESTKCGLGQRPIVNKSIVESMHVQLCNQTRHQTEAHSSRAIGCVLNRQLLRTILANLLQSRPQIKLIPRLQISTNSASGWAKYRYQMAIPRLEQQHIIQSWAFQLIRRWKRLMATAILTRRSSHRLTLEMAMSILTSKL